MQRFALTLNTSCASIEHFYGRPRRVFSSWVKPLLRTYWTQLSQSVPRNDNTGTQGSQSVPRMTEAMEEPPQQVPRHTTSLTRLWRRHDLADSVTKFLPTQALAVLPNLSRTFEQDKFRMLLVAMRASGSAAACTAAMLSTLQTSGRDAGHYHYTWDRATGHGWRRGKALREAVKASQVSQTTGRYTNLPCERFLRMEKTGYDDSSRDLFLYQSKIGKSCPSGQRRCVRRVRVQFAYEGPTDNWGTSVGSSSCWDHLRPTWTSMPERF